MSKTTEIFTARLKEIMRYFKLKNTDIAKAMNKDSQIIWNYFHNVTKPAWADICDLIEYLQNFTGQMFDKNYLFSDSGDSDLLKTIQALQKELSNQKSAYDELAIKYITLKNSTKIQKNYKK